MLSKEAATDTTARLQAHALTYFKANFNRPNINNISVNATYSNTAGSSVVVNGSISVPTYLMQIFGYDSTTVASSSTRSGAPRGSGSRWCSTTGGR